jgi:ribosomal protein L11 methyltransferase
MNYYKIDIEFIPVTEENQEIAVALLSELPFESFENNEKGISAYIPENMHNETDLNNVLPSLEALFDNVKANAQLVEDENWNETWEKNFTPITIDNELIIKAPFHTITEKYTHNIVIHPKMAFGTGHHATTWAVMKKLLAIKTEGMNVLDMGCGTGVLAILASLKGASQITAIDIDEWAYNNTIENFELNGIKNATVLQGGAALLVDQQFDLILANINRNILLRDMDQYVKVLKPGKKIIFSGFYTEDLNMIRDKAESLNLSYLNSIEKDNWLAAEFIKAL